RRMASAIRGSSSLTSTAEHPREDRVDVLGVMGEVELGLEFGFAELIGNLRIRFEQSEEVALAAPHWHGIALHRRVGILAAHSPLGQGEHHPLRMNEAAEPVEIALHVLRVNDQFIDEAGKPLEREVEMNRGIGRDTALD